MDDSLFELVRLFVFLDVKNLETLVAIYATYMYDNIHLKTKDY
jgi:hypothetical protein